MLKQADEEAHPHHDHEHHHEHEHGENCTCGCHDHEHHHHHADEVFTSWGVETANKYTKDEITAALEKLAADSDEFGVILRAKGIVASDTNEWIYYDLVPGEYEVRTGKPDYTGKICVIGSNLKEDLLKDLFRV